MVSVAKRGYKGRKLEELTERESEVMALVAKGYKSREIADKLFISLNTVIKHRDNAGRKDKHMTENQQQQQPPLTPGGAPTSEVPGSVDPNAATDITVMSEVFRLRPEERALVSLSSWQDRAGNVFEACRIMLGNGYIRVLKRDPAGNEVARTDFVPPATFKLDDVTLYQSGSHIDIEAAWHHPVEGDYFYGVCKGRWENIAVPYLAGEMPRSAGGAFMPGSEPPPTPYPTKEEIAAEVMRLLQPEINRIIGNMKPKALAALHDEQVLTVPLFAAGGNSDVYLQQVNTAYTGALGAIHDTHGGNAPQEALDAVQIAKDATTARRERLRADEAEKAKQDGKTKLLENDGGGPR